MAIFYLSKGYRLHTCKNCGHKYKDEFSGKKVLSEVSYPYVLAEKNIMFRFEYIIRGEGKDGLWKMVCQKICKN